MFTDETGIWARRHWWRFTGGVSELLRRFGYRVFTRLVGLFEVDCVAGKFAGLCNGNNSGSEESRVLIISTISCLVYKIEILKWETGMIGEMLRLLWKSKTSWKGTKEDR